MEELARWEEFLGTATEGQLPPPGALKHPRAHSSGLGPLVPPQFSAEIVVNAHSSPMGTQTFPRSGGNHLARCKAASSTEGVGWALQGDLCPGCGPTPPGKRAELRRTFRALTSVSSECPLYLSTPPPWVSGPHEACFPKSNWNAYVYRKTRY